MCFVLVLYSANCKYHHNHGGENGELPVQELDDKPKDSHKPNDQHVVQKHNPAVDQNGVEPVIQYGDNLSDNQSNMKDTSFATRSGV